MVAISDYNYICNIKTMSGAVFAWWAIMGAHQRLNEVFHTVSQGQSGCSLHTKIHMILLCIDF